MATAPHVRYPPYDMSERNDEYPIYLLDMDFIEFIAPLLLHLQDVF